MGVSFLVCALLLLVTASIGSAVSFVDQPDISSATVDADKSNDFFNIIEGIYVKGDDWLDDLEGIVDDLGDIAGDLTDVVHEVADLIDIVYELYDLVNIGTDSTETTNQVAEDSQNVADKPKSSLYEAIYNGLLTIDSEIDVSAFTTDSDEGWKVLKEVLRDHPELYYFSFDGSLFWDDGRFEFKYRFPESQIIEMNSELEQMAENIIADHIRADMSDFDKVKAIHDYLVLHTAYDYENYKKDTVPDSSYDIYGTLMNQVAVCEGYAESMVYVLNKINIESIYVSGTANGESHAWNKVNVAGKWYNVDATWDDPVPNKEGYVRYDYFLIPDNELAKDHSWKDAKLPDATDTTYLYMADR